MSLFFDRKIIGLYIIDQLTNNVDGEGKMLEGCVCFEVVC